jgi:PAS domain S-box-containing protein
MCASLVEEAPVGVFLVQDGVVVYANRWLRELSGYESADGPPFDALAAIHPDDRPLVARQMQQRLSGAEPEGLYQARLLRPDGAVRTVEIHARAAEYRGRPAIQGALIDVTEKVGVERALCESVARMEEANRHRQLFSDILCHDLMNPVWVAENYLRLLGDNELPEGLRPLSGGARRSIAKARETLADARTYLQVHDRTAVALEPLSLGPLVEAAAAPLRPLWEEKAQTVNFRLAGDAEVAGSPLLRELVVHLIANAVKYGPPCSPIDVAVRAGARVRLEVHDRGPGVAEEDRERIFRRFELLEKGSIRGTGLGLAIARRIAHLHGGTLRVEASPEGGSLFVAEFPAAGH